MRTCHDTFGIIAISIVSVALLGCRSESDKSHPPLGKVKGTVTYKGKPVADAIVTFSMEKSPRSSVGTTDAEGKFGLTTYSTNDGAFVGTNVVTVTHVSGGKEASQMKPGDLAKSGAPKPQADKTIPAKYANATTSPLKKTVEPGQKEIVIELED